MSNYGEKILKEILEETKNMSVEEYNLLFEKVKMRDLPPEIVDIVDKDFKELLL